MFLNDQETAVDLLYYEAIAATVVKLIKQTSTAPVTIGVHGDWGAGKSSVLKMTEAAFAADKRALCLWFNGWTFEGFEDAKTVVIETLVDELRRKRPGNRKVTDAAKKLLKRIDWLKLARKAGGLAFTAFTGIPTLDQLNALIESAKHVLTTPTADGIKKFAEEAGGLLKEAESEPLPTQIHEFRVELEELIAAADIDKLIVIVDDLDRCLPATAIATLEAIRLFLFVPKTAFVIGADEMMIEYAVRDHFPKLPPNSGPVSYARNYLEKLIQVPFRIPALGLPETRMYVTLLLAENALGADDDGFRKLLVEAREQLRRPWKSSGIDLTIATRLLSKTPPAIVEAIQISGQIARLLTEGTRGNPRQIKRFLNSLMLRQEIADSRGLSSDINRGVLAKLMLAERFAPEVYDHLGKLVASASDGSPVALAAFERHVAASSKPTQTQPLKGPPGGASPRTAPNARPLDLTDESEFFAKNDWTKTWASLKPDLTGVDLRPYLFIARDRRADFSVYAISGHLEDLAEQLMGQKLGTQALKGELAKLTGLDPETLFDALGSRLLQEELRKKPKGTDGIRALVEAHPALQQRLLTLMSNLPRDQLGPWAASTWLACFTEPDRKAELKGILGEWSKEASNTALAKASELALEHPSVKGN